MIKYLYLALEKKLLAITDGQPKPQPVFNHCDLWNRQVEFIEQETPFQTPAVFVEFPDEIKWRTDGQHIQDADLTICLHVVTPWYANTASNVSDKKVRATALEYLDIPSCELLAFILYLCSLKQLVVVDESLKISCELLAFILYLCSLKQHVLTYEPTITGCELLAFILYLCSLKQHRSLIPTNSKVVNCLHLSCIFAL